MSYDTLDTLLVKLASGEESAAERVFKDYEPRLRAMVRRRLTPMLRTKFDSIDIVQSAWVDLIETYRAKGWQLNDREHLKAFLSKVTRNHFFLHCRRNEHALSREQPLPENLSAAFIPSNHPRPSQVAQADELWDSIINLCPAAHREALLLKRQGRSLDEIATTTGLHPSSVRRILYELAHRLARERSKAERPRSLGH